MVVTSRSQFLRADRRLFADLGHGEIMLTVDRAASEVGIPTIAILQYWSVYRPFAVGRYFLLVGILAKYGPKSVKKGVKTGKNVKKSEKHGILTAFS